MLQTTDPTAGAAAPFTKADIQPNSKPVDEEVTNGYTTPPVKTETPAKPADKPASKSKAKPKVKATKSTEKKASKPKAAGKSKRILVFGDKPVTSVIRRLGKNGFKFPEIKAGLAALGAHPSDASIRVFLSAGRHGQRGEPAHLTREELQEFKAKAKEVTAPEEAAAK